MASGAVYNQLLSNCVVSFFNGEKKNIHESLKVSVCEVIPARIEHGFF